jgi:hypothetical protein
MEEELKKVEIKIEKASDIVEKLLECKDVDKASFDSEKEEKLQYWLKEKQDLRKEKLLLLEITKNESESKASIFSLQCS